AAELNKRSPEPVGPAAEPNGGSPELVEGAGEQKGRSPQGVEGAREKTLRAHSGATKLAARPSAKAELVTRGPFTGRPSRGFSRAERDRFASAPRRGLRLCRGCSNSEAFLNAQTDLAHLNTRMLRHLGKAHCLPSCAPEQIRASYAL